METDFNRAQIAQPWVVLIALLSLVALTGCQSVWRAPTLLSATGCHVAGPLANAEANYTAGVEAEEAGNPACIDYFFAAAAESWPAHAMSATATGNESAELYRSALRRLIQTSARFGRLDPVLGLQLANGSRVPITYNGFYWRPDEFRTFLPVGEYASKSLTYRHAASGVGVEYVVLTGTPPTRPFVKAAQPFAMTAVLKPADDAPSGFNLEFYDPLRASGTIAGPPLARDLTAPLAYSASVEGDTWLDSYINPDQGRTASGLHMLEPYQPGKIPLVLVHGLLSDPVTWSHLINELRSHPELLSRYQIWTFRYVTSDPFLTSAADLRRQLAAIRQTYDPLRLDPAASRMIVVGHSMGGLVAKLQVTASSDQLWYAAATRPLETIVTDEATRAQLRDSFYFQPSPDVARVIYIATPHRGSVYARRCIGLLGSALVEEPELRQAREEQLLRDNPGAFRGELNRGVPTSIEILDPDSLILQTTNLLPYRYDMRLHSIIGCDRWTLSEGPSDGVVAVSSARLPGIQSELVVDADHTGIQHNFAASSEVMRILNEHLASVYR